MNAAIRYDDGPYPRARIAFLCVANAGLTEGEMHAMAPAGVGLSFGRVPMGTACTRENLAGMEDGLRDALDSLLPGRRDVDVICYNCTAGSFVIGNDAVRGLIARTRRDGATTLLDGVTAGPGRARRPARGHRHRLRCRGQRTGAPVLRKRGP